MIRRILAIAFFITSSTISLSAQDFSKLNEFFDSLETYDKFMGNIILRKNGENVYSRSLGYKDFDASIKLDKETRFRVGSISKMFTTSLIFKAIEEEKLSLDQKLSGFFPEIENADKITISMLLQHRSGIHNFTNDPLYESYFTSPQTRERMVQIIKEAGSDFEPDSKGDYSNSNFVLLTFILEELYKDSYLNLVKERITEPLQLNNTYVGKAPLMQEAKSYAFENGWKEEEITNMSIPVGAGSIVSTTEDLGKFIEGLFSGKIISEQSLTKMKDIREGYGRGMFQFPYYEHKAYGHNGGIDGFSSMLGYFPEEKLTICYLSNGANYNNNTIILAVLDTYFGKEIEIPSFQTADLKSEDLDKYLGVYSSEQIPLKITFIKDGTSLIAKPTGQPDAILEARGSHVFEFVQAGATMIFDPEKGEMTLKQGGGLILFKREGN